MKNLLLCTAALAAVAAFAEDAYIDADGTQAVVLDYFAKPSTKIVADFAYLSVTPLQSRVFGASGPGAGFSCASYINGSGKYAFAFRDDDGDWISTDVTVTTDRRTFEIDGPGRTATLYTDGTVTKAINLSNPATVTGAFPLTLFGTSKDPDALLIENPGSKVRLYSFAIWDGETQVMDLRPALKNGVYLLKDAVTGRCYGPARGHAFTGGGDIETVTDTLMWTGAAGTADWNTAANWQTSGGVAASFPPDAGDAVVISGTATVDIGHAAATVASLSISGGGTVTFTGKHLDMLAASLSVESGSALNVADGTTVYVPAASAGGSSLGAAVYAGGSQPWISGGGALNVGFARAALDGSVLVFDVPPGMETTYGTALAASVTKVVKRGLGTATLAAASTVFAGEVVVEAGTLAITDLKAVGPSAPVTVEDGGTLWIKTPHAGAQNAPLFNTHTITIAGRGVDGLGALRYTQTSGSGMADNMFGHIILSADATINCTSRWGMDVSTYVLDLAGHTLTLDGSAVILYNKITAGTILINAGTKTLQTSASFPAGTDTTLVITNSGTLALWAQNAAHPVQAAVRLYTGRTIRMDSGAGNTFNGPIHVAKFGGATSKVTDAIFDMSTQYNVTAMTVNGPLTSDTGLGYDYHCRLVMNGGGTLWLNGPVDFAGNVYPRCGWLCMTSTATRVFRNGFAIKNGKVWMADGTFRSGFLRVPNGGDALGLFRQTGGHLSNSADAPRIGESRNGPGWYVLEGGAAYFSNTVLVAENVGSYGMLRQKGGLMRACRTDAGGTLYIGQKGDGVFIQTGGTNDSHVVQGGQDLRTIMNVTNGTSEATISGTGTVFRAEGFSMGWNLSLCTNILNISDGALFLANRFRRHEGAKPGSLSCVNADGGVMAPTFGWGWGAANPGTAAFFPRSPDHFVLWDKGLVFDTSYTSYASGSLAQSMPSFWFEAPTGKGIESISLPTDSAYVPANYYGPARVVFESSTGWGASAYAEYDYDTKKHTKIVITSRGCDYGGDTKVYLESHNRQTRYECAFTLSDNAGHGGPLIKRGPADLYLYATNTYAGGTIVEQGQLIFSSPWTVPPNSAIRVEAGAKANFNGNAATIASFAGPGQTANGNVTVTDSVKASCADLFANRHATFGNALTFAAGAVFEITDPENLETYKNHGSVTAFTAQTVNGAPKLRIPDAYAGSTKWTLFKSGAGSYNFGPVIGTMLLLK